MEFGSSRFEQPKETSQEKEQEKKSGLLFEIKKRLRGFDVSVGIERGEEPITTKIDFINKEIEARITLEGVRKGFEAINKFLNDPQRIEKLQSFNRRLEQWLDEKRKERAQRTLKDYTKQEGKTEAEVVKELLDELGEEKGETE